MTPGKNLHEIVNALRVLMPELKRSFDVHSIGVFGSYVREEQHPGSDLDLLVAFENTPGFFKYIQLENYLSDALGVKVDLVMESALKPSIKTGILKEVQRI